MTKSILSIQSHVAYGHVGNAAAVFPLQRLGFDVWPIMTVQFSNHTGYGAWTGRVFDDDHIDELVRGIRDRGALAHCGGILSGYMGSIEIGRAIQRAVDHVRRENKAALYCCDPVMGDVGRGFFVREDLPDFIRDVAVPSADIVTPNQFELEFLTDRRIRRTVDALDAAAIVRETGPRAVVVTSLTVDDQDSSAIAMLLDTTDGTWLVETPRLAMDPAPNGAGDCTAALLLGRFLLGDTPPEALASTAAMVFAIFETTAAAGTRELALIAAQDKIVAPGRTFAIKKLR